MIRVAAAADLHFGEEGRESYFRLYADVHEHADLLLLAGDLTNSGTGEEARGLVEALRAVRVPMFAVLGNHDFHGEQSERLFEILRAGGINMLDGEHYEIRVRQHRVGIVGTAGFCGGFGDWVLAPLGEPEIKTWVRRAQREAEKIDLGLQRLQSDFRLVVLHYAPIVQTVEGEHAQCYAFLGCSRLAEPIDRWHPDLVVHGHAHRGREHGWTPGGVPVRNVSLHVLHRAYAIYELE